jgi:signal-transduction protein with cAMP-binding, CBS, and nucleotidyltransferase domain
MQQKNIRRIPIVDKETVLGIITDKDIFHAILKNEISLDILVSDAAITEGHKLVFEQCKDYLFDDMLQKR